MKKLRIAVIGAGASGVLARIKLHEIGQDDVTIFEKADDIGGTWRDNTYPGIACDVPSHLYRYSFAPNPDWSRTFSSGAEILAYLRQVVQRYEIVDDVVFGTEIDAATLTDDTWTLAAGEQRFGPFDVVITALGILRYPAYPDIAGLNHFTGEKFHTARFRHDVDLVGKRVGIIGTGSTSIQVVSAIVNTVGHLSVFQRTPQWIMPVPNDPIPQDEQQRYRQDAALLQGKYEHLGRRFNSIFADAVVGENPEAYENMSQQCRQHLQDKVADPALRARLTPDYQVGCKRLIMSDRFYDDIQRPHVTLVTDGISQIEAAGIRTEDGRLHELDVMILATGYDAHSSLAPMKIVGQSGVRIEDEWRDSPSCYLGVAIPSFPNFFMIGGPTSPIGNFSFLMTAEKQCGYILELVKRLASGEAATLAPTKAAVDAYDAAVQARIGSTVWASGCRSWYMDKNGRLAFWPWNYARFEQAMSKPVWADFASVRE